MGSRTNFYKAPNLQGTVGDGNTLQIFLDGGPTYDELRLVSSDAAAADIAFFKVSVDGEERVKLTGQEMLDREIYLGKTATTNHFVLSFVDIMARTLANEAATGLVTQPGQRVLVEVELGSNSLAGTETFDLYVETSPNRKEEVKLFIVRENIPVTKTGENEFAGFRRGLAPGHIRIRRAHCYGAISYLKVEQDERFPYGKNGMIKAVNDALLKSRGKTPITSSTCYTFDPIRNDNVVPDLFDTFSVKGLRFTFTTTDSNNITAVTEYLEAVPQRAAA